MLMSLSSMKLSKCSGSRGPESSIRLIQKNVVVLDCVLLCFAASQCLCLHVKLSQAAVEENLCDPGDGRCRGKRREWRDEGGVKARNKWLRLSLSGQRTVQLADELGPPFLRKVNGHVVDRSPGQSDADADQRVNGVSVQRHDDQEEAAQAVDKREEEGQLWREKSHARS